MKTLTKLALAAAFATAALSAGIASAQPRGDGHRGPPPEAFTACKGKQAADACEVALGTRTITGKCEATPDSTLACRPDHPPGPPPELFAACASKQEGDACQATLGDHTVDGRCQKGRHGTELICRP
jgi:hypothetical protein